MNYTDTQLKQALAKMLPETIYHEEAWTHKGHRWCDIKREVLDTELLHLCWLVEETLAEAEWIDYSAEVETIVNDFSPRYKFEIHAAWQQRVVALAKVKGIEIL